VVLPHTVRRSLAENTGCSRHARVIADQQRPAGVTSASAAIPLSRDDQFLIARLHQRFNGETTLFSDVVLIVAEPGQFNEIADCGSRRYDWRERHCNLCRYRIDVDDHEV
jgi:hypothetical protein